MHLSLSRRDVLKTACAGLAIPLGLPSLLPANRTENAPAKSVLFINLMGGPSHLDTLDMKPNAPVDTQGSFQSIQTKIPGLIACEYLPKFAAAADQYTLLRGIHHSVGDHPQAQQYIASGNRPTPNLRHPSIGSVIGHEYPGSGTVPPFIVVPRNDWHGGYLGDANAPFKTNDYPNANKPFEVRGISLLEGTTIEKVTRRNRLLTNLDTRFNTSSNNKELRDAMKTLSNQAKRMISSPETREAFDLAQEPDSIRSLFPTDELGQGLFLASRLIEFGVPFVSVSHFGWDTHLNNFTGHQKLIPALDNGLDAVMNALRAKGLLEQTLVVVMGEFGRTPKINQNVGRDHYPRANFCIFAGAGVVKGQLLGGTNDAGTAPDDGTDITPDDIAATILHRMGIEPDKTYYTSAGRPVDLIPEGRVISDIFA